MLISKGIRGPAIQKDEARIREQLACFIAHHDIAGIQVSKTVADTPDGLKPGRYITLQITLDTDGPRSRRTQKQKAAFRGGRPRGHNPIGFMIDDTNGHEAGGE